MYQTTEFLLPIFHAALFDFLFLIDYMNKTFILVQEDLNFFYDA